MGRETGNGVTGREPVRERAEPAYRRDAATWVAFGALFAFGVLNAMLGPILPYLRQTEGISYVVAALHQAAFAVGGMTAGVLASRSSAPRRPTIALGLTAAGAAGVLLTYGHFLPVTLGAAMLVSAFGTTALIRVWALLADLHHVHRAMAMSEGEVAVSLAGIATPAVVAACAAAAVGWRFSSVIAFAGVIAAVVAVLATQIPEARPASDRTDAADGQAAPRRTLATIFALVGLEFTLSFWAATYLHDDVGVARGTAVTMVSVLYAANLVGRVAASRLARLLSVRGELRLFLLIAALGLPVLLIASSVAIAAVGLTITGIGIGGTFPLASAVHVAASNRTADQALGQILTIAGVGQIIGPLAAGALAQAGGLRLGLLVLPALTLLAAVTTRRGRAQRRGAAARG
ncbi:MAG: sugar MFS transporter [Jatrophihabitans sp.]|uniref:MFS transporter n=1 Tax=Jatrophihabitans sp. TaxID=1932789 RepID=UPI0039145572